MEYAAMGFIVGLPVLLCALLFCEIELGQMPRGFRWIVPTFTWIKERVRYVLTRVFYPERLPGKEVVYEPGVVALENLDEQYRRAATTYGEATPEWDEFTGWRTPESVKREWRDRHSYGESSSLDDDPYQAYRSHLIKAGRYHYHKGM